MIVLHAHDHQEEESFGVPGTLPLCNMWAGRACDIEALLREECGDELPCLCS